MVPNYPLACIETRKSGQHDNYGTSCWSKCVLYSQVSVICYVAILCFCVVTGNKPKDRGALLSDIRTGTRLKKTITNDRSAPRFT